MDSFYTQEELKNLGFKSIGSKVLISRKASIYSTEEISIGDNVRIDDFCILSGKIELGSNIHISAYVALYGAMGIKMCDYTGLSPRVTIYSAMDDFNGNYLIGPIHPSEYTNVTGGKVFIEKFVQIGCNSVIFPNLTIHEGAVVGAISLVTKSLSRWTINVGVPAKFVRNRHDDLTKLLL